MPHLDRSTCIPRVPYRLLPSYCTVSTDWQWPFKDLQCKPKSVVLKNHGSEKAIERPPEEVENRNLMTKKRPVVSMSQSYSATVRS
eukprot:2702260-Amphidinium_carterae.1